jgi:predicted Zn-dependent protease
MVTYGSYLSRKENIPVSAAWITFFEKLQKREKSKPGRLAGFFRTHPSSEDRIELLMDEQRYLPEKENYIIDSSEFQRVKARLLAIDNAMKAESAGIDVEQKRPTLKRRTNTEGQDPNDPTQEGEKKTKKRPTLKRPGEKKPPMR